MVTFQKCGEENTAPTLSLVIEEVKKRGIKHIVIASTGGKTGFLAAQAFAGTDIQVIVVTHNVGHKVPGECQLDGDMKQAIERFGAKVLTGTTVWESLDESIARLTGLLAQERLIAQTYRTLGEGIKVCVEIALAATDAGLVPEGKDILCVAGTGKGADTAMIVRATSSGHFFEDFFIREILAKPAESKMEMKQRLKSK
ncbi:MAG: pyruvate kinase alpha/beta domain-containing protein [bacterium]|nr:pyruvate kinase alpha/beta domain-containing protein [bacterium]